VSLYSHFLELELVMAYRRRQRPIRGPRPAELLLLVSLWEKLKAAH
jgi:hypothetical protein